MKLVITEYEAENLRLDVKTLVDISRLLEMDGRFKVMPEILNGIATDIEKTLEEKGTVEEVIDRARIS